MPTDIEEFFHDFSQHILAQSGTGSSFQLEAFMESVTEELITTGYIDDFEFCHYRTLRGVRVDGYTFDEDGRLHLFIADFEARTSLESLTATEINQSFKRLTNFLSQSLEGKLEPDITTPEYALIQRLREMRSSLDRVILYLVSERQLSSRFKEVTLEDVTGIALESHIWDMSRLHRQHESRGQKEALDIDLIEAFGDGLNCLPAMTGEGTHVSYLVVMPAPILADLYDKYSTRLLEQNVRTFLQARGKVNKGLRATILNEPGMFFAYNNGITATAEEVATRQSEQGLQITRLKDLQIVNGGQTTASLFHTRRKDRASLDKIFVQMKLTVIDPEQSEQVVPKISEYANTQNRVNAADFFSNHPFHVRMEEFSRRLWAPAQQGSQHETKWFYERARGQYADAQAALTHARKKQFLAEHPRAQKFTKTDLAKFENVFDEHPMWVNRGSQKNFARYAVRVGKLWEDRSDDINEFYFKRAVARGILFRATEKLVSAQEWYNGGYRANVVAYTLAMLGHLAKKHGGELDYMKLWTQQAVSDTLLDAIACVAKAIHDDITQPPAGISNVSEWAKKEGCWTRLVDKLELFQKLLPDSFEEELIDPTSQKQAAREARQTRKLDNTIEAQAQVVKIDGKVWAHIRKELLSRKLLTDKEQSILIVASKIPFKLPTGKQSIVLLDVLEKARLEGLDLPV